MNSLPSYADLGLSRDQYYRRVRLLTDAGVITPERGQKNKLLLSSTDEAVLRQFVAIERDNAERGLQWCLEHLRYEIEKEKRIALEQSHRFAMIEVDQLRKMLQKLTRSPWRRLVKWLRRRSRVRAEKAEDTQTGSE